MGVVPTKRQSSTRKLLITFTKFGTATNPTTALPMKAQVRDMNGDDPAGRKSEKSNSTSATCTMTKVTPNPAIFVESALNRSRASSSANMTNCFRKRLCTVASLYPVEAFEMLSSERPEMPTSVVTIRTTHSAIVCNTDGP